MPPSGHEGVARSDSGNWGVSDPLPGLSGTVPGGLPAAHPDLRPDTGAGGDRDSPLNQNLWDANGHGFVLVVPDELARNCPVSHGAIAAMTEEPVSRGTVCGALCHPGPL